MKNQLHNIFSSLPSAVVYFDESGHVMAANPPAVQMSQQWFGTDVFQVNFLEADGLDEEMKTCFAQHTPFSREVLYDLQEHQLSNPSTSTARKYKIARINYVAVTDDNDQFIGHLALFDDITTEKEAMHSNQLFTEKMKLITEHYGLIHLDCFPSTRTFNLEGGHSLTRQENIPIEVAYKQMHPDDRYLLQEVVENSGSNAARTYELNFRMHMANHPDYRYVTLSLLPNLDERGHLICYTGLMIDNTDRMQLLIEKEQMLQQKEQTLRELQAAKEKAEEADRLKSAFLSNISHEIRTPLNAIEGFCELLTTTDDNAERLQYSKIVRTNTKQLVHLIDDILDLSKLESGTIRIENREIDIRSFLQELYDSYKPKFSESSVQFLFNSCNTPCLLQTDPYRLSNVLVNFLDNAIKYTIQGAITLSYSLEGTNLRIAVSDTGIGIPQKSLNKVFNRFEKLDSLVPGTGLGLSICKHLIEMMNGQIGAESEQGKGSIFWITLPMRKEP